MFENVWLSETLCTILYLRIASRSFHIVHVSDNNFFPIADAYTMNQLVFHWRQYEPVELNDELEMPQFNLEDYDVIDSCQKKYQTG